MRTLRKRTSLREGDSDRLAAQSPTLRPLRRVPEQNGDVEGLETGDLAVDARRLASAAPPLLPRRHHDAGRLIRREDSRAAEGTPGLPVPSIALRTHEGARGEAGMRLLGAARDLRPAIVLATILGPCRALGLGDGPYSP